MPILAPTRSIQMAVGGVGEGVVSWLVVYYILVVEKYEL